MSIKLHTVEYTQIAIDSGMDEEMVYADVSASTEEVVAWAAYANAMMNNMDNKVKAIKTIRNNLDMGLKAAKIFVEQSHLVTSR